MLLIVFQSDKYTFKYANYSYHTKFLPRSDSNLCDLQLILDFHKKADKNMKIESKGNDVQTTEIDNLCIIHTPSNFNKTTQVETRNNIKVPISTTNEFGDATDPTGARGAPKISRAESVKNSRRYYKKNSNLNQARQPNTILSSYLPHKNFMAKEPNLIKPVRQMQRDKKSALKSAFSERNGTRTAKNANRQTSKETFDEFVKRMHKENDTSSEQTYGTKVRPYTSNGYGQLRIKHQKRPTTKSGTGIKLYDEVRNYPYYHNRTYLPKDGRKKSTNRHTEYRSSNLLNEVESKRLNHRCTFYPTSHEDLVNKTMSSNDTYLGQKPPLLQNTYFQSSGKD